MKTTLRFFRPCEYKCCEQYEGDNLIAPQLNSAITLECDCDNVYRVDDINYVYDDGRVMIDIELRLVEDGYWEKHDEYLHDDEFECDGECEDCELNDAVMSDDMPEVKKDKTNYSALLKDAIADLFGELGVKVEFTKE